MIRVIVGIFISNAMAQAFMAAVMGILQMHRNGCLLRLHAAHGFLYGIYRRIALGCTGHVRYCLGKNDLGFRHSHPFHCLCCCRCHTKGLGICVSNIFGSQDHDSSCNKFHIFSCIEHFCQIIDCRIWIGTPHALDKGGNNIVMVVPILVVTDHTLLNALRSHLKGQMDLTVRISGCGENSQFYGV